MDNRLAWQPWQSQCPSKRPPSSFLSRVLAEASCLSAFGRAAPLGSHLIQWLHPPLILERLPPGQMNGVIIWPPWWCRCLYHGWGRRCGMGLLIGVAGWLVVTKRAAKGTFPTSNCKGDMSTPWLLQDIYVRLLGMPLERTGNLVLPSLWPHIPSLACFHQGIIARYGYDPCRQSPPPWCWLHT